MILFAILLAALIAIAVVSAIIVLIGGGVLAVVFGDLIVFVLIIIGLCKIFRKKRK